MSPGRDDRAKAVAAPDVLGLGRRAGVGSEVGCVCCIPLRLFLVHSWELTPIQQVALDGTLKIWGVSKSFITPENSGVDVGVGRGPEEGMMWRGKLASLRIGFNSYVVTKWLNLR